MKEAIVNKKPKLSHVNNWVKLLSTDRQIMTIISYNRIGKNCSDKCVGCIGRIWNVDSPNNVNVPKQL